MYYRLEGRTPVPTGFDEARELQFGVTVARAWFGLPEADGSALVSTVFLPIDHNFGYGGKPVLFETMVFWTGHEIDNECERYHAWDEAEKGHLAMVERVREIWRERAQIITTAHEAEVNG